jgi:hypothetical protein
MYERRAIVYAFLAATGSGSGAIANTTRNIALPVIIRSYASWNLSNE